MDHSADRTVLMTVRVRVDAAYPGELFVSPRRYDVGGDDVAPGVAVEVASADEALDVLSRWLRSLTP